MTLAKKNTNSKTRSQKIRNKKNLKPINEKTQKIGAERIGPL
jgi:hypothetical protein